MFKTMFKSWFFPVKVERKPEEINEVSVSEESQLDG